MHKSFNVKEYLVKAKVHTGTSLVCEAVYALVCEGECTLSV